MTIIVFRDGVMAADSMVSEASGRFVGYVQKVSRSPAGVVGAACGRDGCCQRFHRWIEGGLQGDFVPKSEHGYFGALVAYPDGKIDRMDAMGDLSTINAPFFADGSGDATALGALEMGATAEQAVAVAIKWDTGCGGEIQVERVYGEAIPSSRVWPTRGVA